MDISKIYDITGTVNAAGIQSFVFLLPDDDSGEFIVTGNDKEKNVIVFSRMANDDVIEKSVAISKATTVLDRLSLFDLDKVKVEQEFHGSSVKKIDVRQGRRKASVSFMQLEKAEYFQKCIPIDIVNTITLDKDAVGQLSKAVSAYDPEMISMRGSDDEILIEFSDMTGDTFSDHIGDNHGDSWVMQWATDPMMRLIKNAIKSEDKVSIGISSRGPLHMTVNNVEFLLMARINN